MKKNFVLILSMVSLIMRPAQSMSSADSLEIAPFGKVYIYLPGSQARNIVILISGDAGWKSGVVDFAKEFSRMDNLVIGVDILRYFKELRSRQDECYRVTSDFVELTTAVEKKFDFPDYKPAVIMGYSSGATLVYGILAQSRPGTFLGGISLGFCTDIQLPKMLCETYGLSEKTDITGKSYFLKPDSRLGNHWIVLQGKLDKVCNYEEVADFVNKTNDAELVTLPEIGHGFAKWSDFMPQWKEAFNRLTGLHEENTDATVSSKTISDLPLQITKPRFQVSTKPAVLLISGDGGWYSFEQSIADNLAEQGIPTIGLDSKKYFWKRKTPEETTVDISNALEWYGKEWNKDRFILIGYSLGAEIVPFIVNRLPETLKPKVESSVLLSPDISTDFEIHISNMLGMGNRQNTYNVADEIRKVQQGTTLIIIGEGEKTKIPELLSGSGAIIRKIPGDHHYKFNVPLIISTMKDNKAL